MKDRATPTDTTRARRVALALASALALACDSGAPGAAPSATTEGSATAPPAHATGSVGASSVVVTAPAPSATTTPASSASPAASGANGDILARAEARAKAEENFHTPYSSPGPKRGSIVDVNADGLGDLLVHCGETDPTAFEQQRAKDKILIYLGSDKGLATAPSGSFDIAVHDGVDKLDDIGDVDGDGRTDFVANGPMSTTLWLGDAVKPRELGGAKPVRPHRADLNGDGRLDFAGMGSYQIEGLHKEHKAPPLELPGRREGFRDIAPGDFDGDGVGDVIATIRPAVTGFEAGVAQVFYGTSTDLTPGPVVSAPSGADASKWAVHARSFGDVNGDGIGDLGVQEEFRCWIIYGAKRGEPLSPGPGLAACDALFASDFNGDKIADIVHANGRDQEVAIYYGSASGIGREPSAKIARPKSCPEKKAFASSVVAGLP